MDNKKNLNWDEFRALGNPDNAPEVPQEKKERLKQPFRYGLHNRSIRIFLEKKQRGGKKASVIRGINLKKADLSELARQLKTKCGVGGSAKDNIIIIQGDHRDRILEHLKMCGANDVKKAGG